MNRRCSALALSALATGAVVLATTEASAILKDPDATSTSQGVPAPAAPPEWPDEGTGYPGSEAKTPEYNYPNYDARYEVPRVEDATISSAPNANGLDVVQVGASAVGGAAVAFGAMWLYRRRHLPAN